MFNYRFCCLPCHHCAVLLASEQMIDALGIVAQLCFQLAHKFLGNVTIGSHEPLISWLQYTTGQLNTHQLKAVEGEKKE